MLHDLPADDLRPLLVACLSVERWVDDVASGAPYPSDEALLEAAGRAAVLSPSEIDEALAHHPRIGERAEGEGRSSAFSRTEQSASTSDDPELAERLLAGNRRYEQRFDRVFLIRAAGRSRAEIVAELERRLELEPGVELAIVAEQLREITLLRLHALADEHAADPKGQNG